MNQVMRLLWSYALVLCWTTTNLWDEREILNLKEIVECAGVTKERELIFRETLPL